MFLPNNRLLELLIRVFHGPTWADLMKNCSSGSLTGLVKGLVNLRLELNHLQRRRAVSAEETPSGASWSTFISVSLHDAAGILPTPSAITLSICPAPPSKHSAHRFPTWQPLDAKIPHAEHPSSRSPSNRSQGGRGVHPGSKVRWSPMIG